MKIYIACFVVIAFTCNAQQLPMLSNYFYKPFAYNPALAGDKDVTEVFASHKSMFSNFQGSPALSIVSVDGKLKAKKAYAGLYIANQSKGLFNNTNAFASYAYRANFTENIYLKLGLSAGIFDQSVNYSKLAVQNYADPNLFVTNQRKTGIDANAGFSFHAMGLTVGFSVPQLLGTQLKYSDNFNTRSYYQQTQHFLGSLQYEIPVNKEKEIYVTPYGLMRFVTNAPLQYDGGVNFDWKDKFWIGATYKSDYAVGINAGVTLNRRMSVGYSYDYMIGNIANYAGTSHEIMLAFKFGKLKYRAGDDTLTAQDRKLMQLQKEIDELKKNGVKASADNSGKTNNTATPSNSKFQGKNAVKENGIYILTNKVSDFTHGNGAPMVKGFYIVVESIFYKDYAEQEMKRYMSFGFPDADYMIDKTTKFHYIYVSFTTDRLDAMSKVQDAKDAGVPDVWIEALVD